MMRRNLLRPPSNKRPSGYSSFKQSRLNMTSAGWRSRAEAFAAPHLVWEYFRDWLNQRYSQDLTISQQFPVVATLVHSSLNGYMRNRSKLRKRGCWGASKTQTTPLILNYSEYMPVEIHQKKSITCDNTVTISRRHRGCSR